MSRLMCRMVDAEMLMMLKKCLNANRLMLCCNASMLAPESYDMLSWYVSSSPPMVPY